MGIRLKQGYGLLLMLLMLSACSGTRPSGVQQAGAKDALATDNVTDLKGAPAWVNKGSQLFVDNNRRVFRGVAATVPMGDWALQKAVADDRARAEVARMLNLYLDAVCVEFLASPGLQAPGVQPNPKELASSVAQLSSQFDGIRDGILANTRIIGSWRDLKTSHVWSIAELDIMHLRNVLADAKNVDGALKRQIEADTLFDFLASGKSRETPADQNE